LTPSKRRYSSISSDLNDSGKEEGKDNLEEEVEDMDAEVDIEEMIS
jgi:hypothetical protein